MEIVLKRTELGCTSAFREGRSPRGGGVCCLKRLLGEAEEEACTIRGFDTSIERCKHGISLIRRLSIQILQGYQVKRDTV